MLGYLWKAKPLITHWVRQSTSSILVTRDTQAPQGLDWSHGIRRSVLVPLFLVAGIFATLATRNIQNLNKQ